MTEQSLILTCDSWRRSVVFFLLHFFLSLLFSFSVMTSNAWSWWRHNHATGWNIAICHIGGALVLEHIALEVGWIMNWVIYHCKVYWLGLRDSSRRLKRISQGWVRLHSSRSQLGTWYYQDLEGFKSNLVAIPSFLSVSTHAPLVIWLWQYS